MSFQQNVHNFRAFAIAGVVGAHSLQNFAWPDDSLVFRVLDTLFNQSTIWFAFIAGYLFQALSGRYSTPDYYMKKIKNVLTPYLICSVPALFASMFLFAQEMPRGFYDYSYLKQAALFLVTGKHLAPYWYIPMITLIFVIAPLLIKLDRNPRFYAILFLLVPLSAWLGRDGLLIHTSLTPYYSQLSKAVYLIAPYVFGMYCSRYSEIVMERVGRYVWPLAAISLAFFVAEVAYYHQTTYRIFLFKVISAPLILWSLQVRFGRAQAMIDTVADRSFGLFFIHGYILASVTLALKSSTGQEDIQLVNVAAYACFLAIVLTASLGITTLVRRILGPRNSIRLIGC